MLTAEQKQLLLQKLANKINSEGLLQVKSQTERSQLGNKELVVKNESYYKTSFDTTQKKKANKAICRSKGNEDY